MSCALNNTNLYFLALDCYQAPYESIFIAIRCYWAPRFFGLSLPEQVHRVLQWAPPRERQLYSFGRVLRGNTIRGNRPERFWEGNLPLRGSLRGPLRGPLRGMVSELFRAFQSFLEVFRGFQRFSEVFRGFQRFFKGPLRDPLRVPFSSQSWGSCCP